MKQLLIVSLVVFNLLCISLGVHAFAGQYVSGNTTANICEDGQVIAGAFLTGVYYPQGFFRVTNKVNNTYSQAELVLGRSTIRMINLALNGNQLLVEGLEDVAIPSNFIKIPNTPTALDCWYNSEQSLLQYKGHYIGTGGSSAIGEVEGLSNDTLCEINGGLEYSGYYNYEFGGGIIEGFLELKQRFGVLYGKWIEGSDEGDIHFVRTTTGLRGVYKQTNGANGGFMDYRKDSEANTRLVNYQGRQKCEFYYGSSGFVSVASIKVLTCVLGLLLLALTF